MEIQKICGNHDIVLKYANPFNTTECYGIIVKVHWKYIGFTTTGWKSWDHWIAIEIYKNVNMNTYGNMRNCMAIQESNGMLCKLNGIMLTIPL